MIRPNPALRLLRRELRLLLVDWRARLVAVMSILLAVTSAWVATDRYRTNRAECDIALEGYYATAGRASASQLADMAHPVLKPPWRLAFLVDGGQIRVPNVSLRTLSVWEASEQLTGWHRPDERLPKTEPLDLAFLLRVFLSFAAVLLGFDAFSAPWQRTRLALVLSLPVTRWQVLAAKITALWIALAVPFVAAVAASMAVVTFVGSPELGGSELVKIVLVTALGVWATLVFVLLALNVSLRSRRASHSLAGLAFLWTALVVVVPAGGVLGARLLHPVANHSELERRLQEVRRASESEHGAPSLRPWPMAHADGFAVERRAAEIERARTARQAALYRAHLEAQRAQLRLARALMAISPTALVQDLAERLAGTGPERDRRFLAAAREFHDVLARHVEALDRGDPESPHILFLPGYLSSRAVDAADVPVFTFAEMTPGECLRAAIGQLGWLALLSAMLLAAAILGFARWTP